MYILQKNITATWIMLFHANRRQGVSFSVHMFTNQETFPSAGTITISQDINNDSKDKHISFFTFYSVLFLTYEMALRRYNSNSEVLASLS